MPPFPVPCHVTPLPPPPLSCLLFSPSRRRERRRQRIRCGDSDGRWVHKRQHHLPGRHVGRRQQCFAGLLGGVRVRRRGPRGVVRVLQAGVDGARGRCALDGRPRIAPVAPATRPWHTSPDPPAPSSDHRRTPGPRGHRTSGVPSRLTMCLTGVPAIAGGYGRATACTVPTSFRPRPLCTRHAGGGN